MTVHKICIKIFNALLELSIGVKHICAFISLFVQEDRNLRNPSAYFNKYGTDIWFCVLQTHFKLVLLMNESRNLLKVQ